MSGWVVSQSAGEHWGLAAKTALDGLGPLPDGANIGFVYVTEGLGDDLSSIVTFLRETTGVAEWFGAVAYGVLGPAGPVQGGRAVTLMVGHLPPSVMRGFDGYAPDKPDAFATAHAGWIGAQTGIVTALVHGDPREEQLAAMILGVAEAGPIYLVGGLTVPSETPTQVAGRVSGAGLSGLMVGDGVTVLTGLSQGCQPIGKAHRVTEAVDNVVMQLDGRPALEVLKEEAGDIIARDLRRAQGYIHIALPTEGSDYGHDYQVRSLLAVDPKRGWLAVGERLVSGQRLLFVRRDSKAAQQDFARMLDGLVKRLEGRSPAAGLYVSCVARGANMFGEEDRESEMIREALGTFPLIGYSAGGEICHDRLYSYTGILVLFL